VSRQIIIEMRDVWFSYREREVLKGVNLRLYEGENLVILGGSGSGKSTILRLLLGLEKCSRGRIYIFGKDVTDLNEDGWFEVRRKIGMVFQEGALFDYMSVRENVGFRLYEEGYKEENIDRIVREKLRIVGLESVIDAMPGDLSGGMKRRVAIARALVGEPGVIFYDEPTTGLDPITARTIVRHINMLKEQYRVASIIVTHELEYAFSLADRLMMLKDGKFIFEGSVEDFKRSRDPYIVKFLGREEMV